MAENKSVKTKKVINRGPSGCVTVTSGFNNTIVTLNDSKNQVVAWSTPGTAGYSGARKSTPFAASAAAAQVAQRAVESGIKEVSVFVKGPGMGRDAAIKALKAGGLRILSITDKTPIPHNGCRPKKRRRV